MCVDIAHAYQCLGTRPDQRRSLGISLDAIVDKVAAILLFFHTYPPFGATSSADVFSIVADCVCDIVMRRVNVKARHHVDDQSFLRQRRADVSRQQILDILDELGVPDRAGDVPGRRRVPQPQVHPVPHDPDGGAREHDRHI